MGGWCVGVKVSEFLGVWLHYYVVGCVVTRSVRLCGGECGTRWLVEGVVKL